MTIIFFPGCWFWIAVIIAPYTLVECLLCSCCQCIAKIIETKGQFGKSMLNLWWPMIKPSFPQQVRVTSQHCWNCVQINTAVELMCSASFKTFCTAGPLSALDDVLCLPSLTYSTNLQVAPIINGIIICSKWNNGNKCLLIANCNKWCNKRCNNGSMWKKENVMMLIHENVVDCVQMW